MHDQRWLKVISCWVAGLVASVAIIELGTVLTGMTGSPSIGFPISVALIAFFVILCEKVPALDFIPAWFVGAACFFASNNLFSGDYAKSVPVLLISCLEGAGLRPDHRFSEDKIRQHN